MSSAPSSPDSRFSDRRHAGRTLAAHLSTYVGLQDVLVLELPRGGAPVAYEAARGLDAPLHVFVVHKLEASAQPELAMGAIASGGVRVLNGDVRRASGIPETTLDARTRRLGPQRPNTRRDRLSLGS